MHRTTSRRHRPRAYFVLAFHSGQSCGGGGRIRTYEGVSRQIYSLLPLAAWVPLRENEPRILISAPGHVNAEIGPIAATGGAQRPREFKYPSTAPRTAPATEGAQKKS